MALSNHVTYFTGRYVSLYLSVQPSSMTGKEVVYTDAQWLLELKPGRLQGL